VREFPLSLSLVLYSVCPRKTSPFRSAVAFAGSRPSSSLRSDGRAQRGAPKIRLVSTRSARRHRVAVGDIHAESRTRRRSLSVTVVRALAAVVARNDPRGAETRCTAHGAIPPSSWYPRNESDRGRYAIREEARSHPAANLRFGQIRILRSKAKEDDENVALSRHSSSCRSSLPPFLLLLSKISVFRDERTNNERDGRKEDRGSHTMTLAFLLGLVN